MSVRDSVTAELDRLGITDWRREIAARLAEKVDDDGAASAASLLRTLMVDAVSEKQTEATAVDLIRASIVVKPDVSRARRKGRRRAPETPPETPETVPESAPGTPVDDVSGTICVECGQPMPPQSSGRPRVRHPECPRTRGRRSENTSRR